MSAIESVLHEGRVFDPPATLVAEANVSGMEAYEALVAEARRDYEGFWSRLAREYLTWKRPFTKTLDESNAPFYTWFEDGTLNASFNSLDRHVESGNGERIAIIFEADDGQVTRVSYRELLDKVCRFANALKAKGIEKGDRVVIYMPMSIEGVVAMQACARIGATHSVVFGGFSAKSLNERVVDAGAVAIVTADQQVRGGRKLSLKAVVDDALALGGCEHVRSVIVYQRTGGDISWDDRRDCWMHELVKDQPESCEPEWVGAEHPLFILCTSGSTGKPKGVLHTTGGFLLSAAVTMHWTFDWKQRDVFWCTADIGWLTGHTYIAYGPLTVGGTQLMFEGVPTYPDAARFWKMVKRHQVSVFYTAPTAIRSLIQASESDEAVHPRSFDLSSLRIIGTVGEPINPEAWIWYHTNVGNSKCPVVDTWWQTETGAHMIAPLPGATPLVPGSCTLPLPGIMAAAVDEFGREVPHGEGGVLVIQRPWPGMLRNIWGDPERYRSTYFPPEMGGHIYLAGDGVVRDPVSGYFKIMGRIDDVLNVSGHRLGTMEIESALSASALVAEAAVVSRPDERTGEAIVAFIVLHRPCPEPDRAAQVADELRAWIGKQIGPIAKPKEIRFSENLPKTRSGKIMRRLLRALARGETITQDVSTLENPAILTQLEQVR